MLPDRLLLLFSFPCSADHERYWPPCNKVVFRVGNQYAECEKQQLLLPCVMVYYIIVSGLFLMFFWCPCMAINVNVQYNGGLFPIILLTQCYLHRGTCLNAMERLCICSL